MSDPAHRLLAWFRTRERDVPGRQEADPYRIWVAEVMAQQTRIQTVAAYYDSFLERFPDIPALAASTLDDVLKAWEGLGYYGRARNLHRAAREIVRAYGGRLPEDTARLRSLPGVGPYTAGALASIAFGRPEPAVDGNVRRVLSRLYDIETPSPAVLDARARSLIADADGEAGSLNQALMDLGSSICTPRSPRCPECPVSSSCSALERGTVSLRPGRRPRRELPHHDIGAALVWRDRRLLIAKRPEDGLLGGLWEFPGGKVEAGESPAEAARREALEEMDVEIEILAPADTVRHAYSHFRITLHLFHAEWISGGPALDSGPADSPRWVRPDDLARYAFPAANRAVIQKLLQGQEASPRCPGPA